MTRVDRASRTDALTNTSALDLQQPGTELCRHPQPEWHAEDETRHLSADDLLNLWSGGSILFFLLVGCIEWATDALGRPPFVTIKGAVSFDIVITGATAVVWMLLHLYNTRRGTGDTPQAALQDTPASPAVPPATPDPPAILQLRQALTENLERARQSGEALWLYDAAAALDDYLPTTLALHAQARGTDVTPELLEACARILTISTSRQTRPDDTAWKVHQRFLAARAEEPGDPDLLRW